jgi:putative transposase
MSIPRRHANPAKIASGERTFFITASTWGKRNLLQCTRTAELLIETIRAYRAQGKYRLHEFVVMPDHFHALITVDVNMTVEKAVQLMKGGFSFRAARELRIKAPFWQKGFSEIRVFDSETFENQRHYIHHNPVKAHLAARPEEYSYSSAREPQISIPCPSGSSRCSWKSSTAFWFEAWFRWTSQCGFGMETLRSRYDRG